MVGSSPVGSEPQRGAKPYTRGMSDYLTYKLIGLAVVGVAYFVWGLYCGLNGRDLSGRRVPHDQVGRPPKG